MDGTISWHYQFPKLSWDYIYIHSNPAASVFQAFFIFIRRLILEEKKLILTCWVLNNSSPLYKWKMWKLSELRFAQQMWPSSRLGRSLFTNAKWTSIGGNDFFVRRSSRSPVAFGNSFWLFFIQWKIKQFQSQRVLDVLDTQNIPYCLNVCATSNFRMYTYRKSTVDGTSFR